MSRSVFNFASLLALCAALLSQQSVRADGDVTPGDFGADAIFVHPIGAGGTGDSVRASLSVTAVKIDTTFGQIDGPTFEATVGQVVGTGQVELPKAKAQLLTLMFGNAIPVGIASLYRNMDQGIDIAGDLLSVRVPIKITQGGGIILQPGVDLGVRHYVAPVNQTSFNASFVVDLRAATDLIKNWLSTGIMAEVRYDADTGSMSGFAEEGMGYLSLLLDRDNRLYARVYAGAEHVDANAVEDLPTVNVFGGIGLSGSFGN